MLLVSVLEFTHACLFYLKRFKVIEGFWICFIRKALTGGTAGNGVTKCVPSFINAAHEESSKHQVFVSQCWTESSSNNYTTKVAPPPSASSQNKLHFWSGVLQKCGWEPTTKGSSTQKIIGQFGFLENVASFVFN